MRAVIIFIMLNILFPSFAVEPYQHDNWGTQPRDLFFEYKAFVVSFDGPDDDDGDGKPDLWGIPEFVAYEIRRSDKKYKLAKRPKWTTNEKLHELGIAPADETYAVSGTSKLPKSKPVSALYGVTCAPNPLPKESANKPPSKPTP
jgi:hypothetical protein